jgi:hypothetical protein
MSRTLSLHDQLSVVVPAQGAEIALRDFLAAWEEAEDSRHGLDLDRADACVCEVESFVKAYKALFGSPVR